MGYIDEDLMSGEQVIYRTKLHWRIFLGPTLLLLTPMFQILGCALLALLYNVLFNDNSLHMPQSPFGPLPLILSLVAIGWGILSFISFKTSEFGITNERVLVKVGAIKRKSLEILLKNVEAIQVNQGVLGRILNYGTIQVIGTGGTRNRLRGIVKPLEFRKKLQEQLASRQQTN